jgi:hypothetical protein
VAARGGQVAGAREAAHQQLVRALVERVERKGPGGERRGVDRRARRQRAERGVAQRGLAQPAEPPPLHQQPRLEHRAGLGVDPLQQLAAGERGIRRAGRKGEHVDVRVRRQCELQRVAAQRVGRAERAAQLRERPAERAERITGVAEDQPGELRARHGPFGQQRVGEHRPRFVATRRHGDDALALDLRLSQQANHERGHWCGS